LLLLCIFCRWCKIPFCMCRCCYRGHAYCCKLCRDKAKQKSRLESQRRYRQTEKGKKAHRDAENRRRHKKIPKNQKNMDDPSSSPISAGCIDSSWPIKSADKFFFQSGETGFCHFCGKPGIIVLEFPRRGYG